MQHPNWKFSGKPWSNIERLSLPTGNCVVTFPRTHFSVSQFGNSFLVQQGSIVLHTHTQKLKSTLMETTVSLTVTIGFSPLKRSKRKYLLIDFTKFCMFNVFERNWRVLKMHKAWLEYKSLRKAQKFYQTWNEKQNRPHLKHNSSSHTPQILTLSVLQSAN